MMDIIEIDVTVERTEDTMMVEIRVDAGDAGRKCVHRSYHDTSAQRGGCQRLTVGIDAGEINGPGITRPSGRALEFGV